MKDINKEISAFQTSVARANMAIYWDLGLGEEEQTGLGDLVREMSISYHRLARQHIKTVNAALNLRDTLNEVVGDNDKYYEELDD